jgi:hypothetical protein
MKGLNKVIVSGNVLGNIEYGRVTNGSEVCGFSVASDRHSANGVVTAFVKVNVYVEGLVRICKLKLFKGAYALVEGELMNRDTRAGTGLLEIRAREILFLANINFDAALPATMTSPDDLIRAAYTVLHQMASEGVEIDESERRVIESLNSYIKNNAESAGGTRS